MFLIILLFLNVFQMLSLLPGRILRLLEFIGFSGNRVFDLMLAFSN